jgi:hypothetical protein
MRFFDPDRDRFPRLLGDLELHRSLRLALHDDCARSNPSTLNHVVDTKSD